MNIYFGLNRAVLLETTVYNLNLTLETVSKLCLFYLELVPLSRELL